MFYFSLFLHIYKSNAFIVSRMISFCALCSLLYTIPRPAIKVSMFDVMKPFLYIYRDVLATRLSRVFGICQGVCCVFVIEVAAFGRTNIWMASILAANCARPSHLQCMNATLSAYVFRIERSDVMGWRVGFFFLCAHERRCARPDMATWIVKMLCTMSI